MVEQTTYYYDQVKGSGGPLIALSFAWAGGVDLEQVRQSSRELREEMGETLLKSRNDLEGRLAEADSILSAIRSKSAETGVADHAELFKNAACRFKKEKNRWLTWVKSVAALGTALALTNTVYVLWYINRSETSVDTGEAVQIAVAKLVLFSFVYYALVWVIGMYRAAAHNEIVNEHRFRGMQSFEKFVAATSDEQTKQAVLLRATESIFDHQSSGMSPHGQDAGASRWLEIVRSSSPPRLGPTDPS